MPKPIHLYASSSPDLVVEREVIAQIVAALPLAIGWEIGHTPLPGQLGSERLVSVEACDLYALLLGRDFSAPMGDELRLARAFGHEPFGVYRLKCTLSPSAQDAVRTLDLSWHEFSSTERFRAMFQRDLLQAVLKQATSLGLVLGEVQRLIEQARELEGADDKRTIEHTARQRGEAGQSGRILGREVWQTEV
jgi:hypothetical protein